MRHSSHNNALAWRSNLPLHWQSVIITLLLLLWMHLWNFHSIWKSTLEIQNLFLCQKKTWIVANIRVFVNFLRLFSHHHLIFHVRMKKKTWYFFTEFKTDTKRANLYRKFINLLSEAKQAKAFKLTNKVVSRSLVCFFFIRKNVFDLKTEFQIRLLQHKVGQSWYTHMEMYNFIPIHSQLNIFKYIRNLHNKNTHTKSDRFNMQRAHNFGFSLPYLLYQDITP